VLAGDVDIMDADGLANRIMRGSAYSRSFAFISG
jgi:hypothetical protein